jgi:hypothetical protein
MRRSHGSLVALLGAWAVVMTGCRDTPVGPGLPDDPGTPSPAAFVGTVSDPVTSEALSRPLPATGPGAGAVVADSLAFVSAPPGSMPDAIDATIANVRTGEAVMIVVADGGFDPVAIEANTGDTLAVTVTRSAGGPMLAKAIVADRRRPRVVRTQPSRGRTDVAINATVVVIFSEPVDPASLGGGGVQLLRDGAAVPGIVRPAAGSAFGVEFVPSASLEPGTSYELVLAGEIKDLSGDPLEGGGTTGFTTTPAPPDISTSGAWISRAAAPTARMNGAVAVVDGIIFALGGEEATWDYGSRVLVGAVEAYDPATDSWTTRASLPTPRTHLAAAAVNGIIYAVGGSGSGIVATVEAYDPATDTWTPRAPLPVPMYGMRLAVVGGKLYSIGSDDFLTTRVDIYDPVADRWAAGRSLPAPHMNGAVAVHGNLIYVAGGGGFAEPSFLATLHVYDPATDSWASRTPMPTARAYLGAAVSDGLIYAVGGVTGRIDYGVVETYDPRTNSWQRRSPLPSVSGVAPNVVDVNGTLYVIEITTLVHTP